MTPQPGPSSFLSLHHLCRRSVGGILLFLLHTMWCHHHELRDSWTVEVFFFLIIFFQPSVASTQWPSILFCILIVFCQTHKHKARKPIKYKPSSCCKSSLNLVSCAWSFSLPAVIILPVCSFSLITLIRSFQCSRLYTVSLLSPCLQCRPLFVPTTLFPIQGEKKKTRK